MDIEIDYVIAGQRIRKMRLYRGMTLDALANEIGLSRESLRHIESATNKPGLLSLYRIAIALNVSLDYLSGRTPEFPDSFVQDYTQSFGLNRNQEKMLHELISGMIPIITDHL